MSEETPTLYIYRAPGANKLTHGSKKAAGLDICAFLEPEAYQDGLSYPHYEYILQPGARVALTTGIHIRVPDGYYGRVAPRSGLALKKGIDVLAGVIDSDYTGEVKVILLNTGLDPVTISNGDKIAQIILEKIAIPYTEEVELPSDLGVTQRGANGFGSTG